MDSVICISHRVCYYGLRHDQFLVCVKIVNAFSNTNHEFSKKSTKSDQHNSQHKEIIQIFYHTISVVCGMVYTNMTFFSPDEPETTF